MIRRPLSSLKLKQTDIEHMERELEKSRQANAEDTDTSLKLGQIEENCPQTNKS